MNINYHNYFKYTIKLLIMIEGPLKAANIIKKIFGSNNISYLEISSKFGQNDLKLTIHEIIDTQNIKKLIDELNELSYGNIIIIIETQKEIFDNIIDCYIDIVY